MPKMKNRYKDPKKFLKTRNAQRQRYYSKTAVYEPSYWTPEQDQLVLEHAITDTELSAKIGHSVSAIQNRRCKLKKAIKEEVE